MFGLVQRELETAGFAGQLPAGAVLTGGGAQLPGIVELGREVFAMPARAGLPVRGITGLVDRVNAPAYAVPVGLVLYAARESIHGMETSNMGVDRLLGPVKKFFGPVKKWLQDSY